MTSDIMPTSQTALSRLSRQPSPLDVHTDTMNRSSSGSPNTPSSHVSFPYSNAATAATSTNTLPSSNLGLSGSDSASPGKYQTHSSGNMTVLSTPVTGTKPRAHSASQTGGHGHGHGHGHTQTRVHPTFSPPYPTSSLMSASTSAGAGEAGSSRPQRPTFSRRKTSASSGGQSAGKDRDRESFDAGEAAGRSGAKRASKACENCRLRRRKCSEQRPCKACVEIGLGASCVFRTKARPNRALPKVVDNQLSLDALVLDPPLQLPQSQIISPQSTGISHGHPIRDIDLAVELWLAEQGHSVSLTLYDPPSLVADLSARSLPPLLSPAAETHAVHSFLDSTARYFAFIHGPRLLEMLRLYHLSPPHLAFFATSHAQPAGMTSPGGLRPDERAMVYAAICLGRFKEVPPAAGGGVQVAVQPRPESVVGGGGNSIMTPASAAHRGSTGDGSRVMVPLSVRLREMREDSGYFCRALLELQNWGGASLTALGAMHCLHLFTLLSGGAAEMRDILGRMVWQVRELGLHRPESAATFPVEDKVERLFYTTLHEDNWFATLLDAPPYIQANTYDPSLTPSWDREGIDGERWIDQHPCVVQLTMFENEMLTAAHTIPELSQSYVLDLEARLADWMKIFREEQLAVPSWMLHTYANIRFHWLRIMLRAPLLSHPNFRLSSLATVCRSASQVLLSYHSFSHTASFLPTWGECRRILTAAHIIVLGHWEGEYAMMESEFLGGVAVALIEKLEGGCPFLGGAKDRLLTMFGLLGIAPRKPGLIPPAAPEPEAPEPVQRQPEPPAPPPISISQQAEYRSFEPSPAPQQQQPQQQQQYAPMNNQQQGYHVQPHVDAGFTLPAHQIPRSLGASPLHGSIGLADVDMGLQHTFAPPLQQPAFDNLGLMSTSFENQVGAHHSAPQSLLTSPNPHHAQPTFQGGHLGIGGAGMGVGVAPHALVVNTEIPRPGSAHSLAHLSAGSGHSLGADTTVSEPIRGGVPGASFVHGTLSGHGGKGGLGQREGATGGLGSGMDVGSWMATASGPASGSGLGVGTGPGAATMGSGGGDADEMALDDEAQAWLDPWLDAMLWTGGSDGNSVTGSASRWQA